ncbi:MAG: sigma-70 family RNA polymerase sigma factor [Chloroflexota bacterium]
MQDGEASDEQIMEGVRRGDSQAIGTLYDRYGGVIFSLGLRMLGDRETTEELVQEVFLRAWRQAGTYQPRLGRLSTWLMGIARNLAVDELRRRAARPRRTDGNADEQLARISASDEGDPVEQLWITTRRQEVGRALAALPPPQRQVMELAYYSGLTQSEIAARLGDPLGTVKTRMRLATQKLRDLLHEMDQVPG